MQEDAVHDDRWPEPTYRPGDRREIAVHLPHGDASAMEWIPATFDDYYDDDRGGYMVWILDRPTAGGVRHFVLSCAGSAVERVRPLGEKERTS